MPNNPSLLDDIEAEYHSVLLTAGNLPAGKKALAQKARPAQHSPAPLALVINWQFSANIAMVAMHTCAGCGSINKILTGFFREEVGPMQAKRLQNLNKTPSFNPLTDVSRVDLTPITVAVCPDCIPSPL